MIEDLLKQAHERIGNTGLTIETFGEIDVVAPNPHGLPIPGVEIRWCRDYKDHRGISDERVVEAHDLPQALRDLMTYEDEIDTLHREERLEAVDRGIDVNRAEGMGEILTAQQARRAEKILKEIHRHLDVNGLAWLVAQLKSKETLS